MPGSPLPILSPMASTDTLATDYRAITEACGLFDRSERGKLALTGGDAKAFLQGQISNDVEGLTPGTGCYAAFLTPKGKMLGDLRILDTGDELLLDTERARSQGLFNMIRRFSIGYDVELHKRTLESGPAVADRAPGQPLSPAPRRRPSTPMSSPSRRAAGPRDPHRRRHRPALRRAGHRGDARRRCASAGATESPKRRPSACGSSTAGPATASTSTTA